MVLKPPYRSFHLPPLALGFPSISCWRLSSLSPSCSARLPTLAARSSEPHGPRAARCPIRETFTINTLCRLAHPCTVQNPCGCLPAPKTSTPVPFHALRGFPCVPHAWTRSVFASAVTSSRKRQLGLPDPRTVPLTAPPPRSRPVSGPVRAKLLRHLS